MRRWQTALEEAVKLYIQQATDEDDASHVGDTPARVVSAWSEFVSGYLVEPASVLCKKFSQGNYDEMIHLRSIRFTSRCKHHFEPIVGKIHFAYVPNDCIVGLSKIPRFVRILAHRLQVQEELTEQIVDTFQNIVKPAGCAVVVKAYHFCMVTRGVREHAEVTETTAFRGVFKTKAETRAEFLSSVNPQEVIFP